MQSKSVSGKPSLILKANIEIAQNITAIDLKQINIIPTLANVNPDILRVVKDFEQYRIAAVSVHFLNLVPVDYQQSLGPV